MNEKEHQYIREIVHRGGPDPADYAGLMDWFSEVMWQYEAGLLGDEDIAAFWADFGDAFSTKTLQGLAARKPHGYHGDYEIMDRIYTESLSTEPNFRKWDLFFQSQPACRAVRNRIECFRSAVDSVSGTGDKLCIVLCLGCGPARDAREYLVSNPTASVSFLCVDQDKKALEYASFLCRSFPSQVRFLQANVIQKLPAGEFSLIWASGLFDYFNDRIFVFMLKRLFKHLKPRGSLIIGNFSPTNPSKDYMDFAGWNLYYRTDQDLIALARKALIPPSNINVIAEGEGINLFLKITRNSS